LGLQQVRLRKNIDERDAMIYEKEFEGTAKMGNDCECAHFEFDEPELDAKCKALYTERYCVEQKFGRNSPEEQAADSLASNAFQKWVDAENAVIYFIDEVGRKVSGQKVKVSIKIEVLEK
jgi:hypothetical protein